MANEVSIETLGAACDRIAMLEHMLHEAMLQIEYLHEKFKPTATSEVVLARIRKALS